MDNIFNSYLEGIYYEYFGMTKTDFGMYFMKGQWNIYFTVTSTCTINSYEGAFLVAVFSYLISAFFMHFQKRILAYSSKVGQNISKKI